MDQRNGELDRGVKVVVIAIAVIFTIGVYIYIYIYTTDLITSLHLVIFLLVLFSGGI